MTAPAEEALKLQRPSLSAERRAQNCCLGERKKTRPPLDSFRKSRRPLLVTCGFVEFDARAARIATEPLTLAIELAGEASKIVFLALPSFLFALQFLGADGRRKTPHRQLGSEMSAAI